MSLKELFTIYREHNATCDELKTKLDAALKEKSKAVEAIAKTIAPKKRIEYNGKELTIVVRGDTFFFKGEGKTSDVVKVSDE